MPLYTFKNNKTGEIYDIHLSLSEREVYIKENDVTQQLYKSNLVSGVGDIKQADGFKDILKHMKKKNPGSTIQVN